MVSPPPPPPGVRHLRATTRKKPAEGWMPIDDPPVPPSSPLPDPSSRWSRLRGLRRKHAPRAGDHDPGVRRGGAAEQYRHRRVPGGEGDRDPRSPDRGGGVPAEVHRGTVAHPLGRSEHLHPDREPGGGPAAPEVEYRDDRPPPRRG